MGQGPWAASRAGKGKEAKAPVGMQPSQQLGFNPLSHVALLH